MEFFSKLFKKPLPPAYVQVYVYHTPDSVKWVTRVYFIDNIYPRGNDNTTRALKQLEEELYAISPETVDVRIYRTYIAVSGDILKHGRGTSHEHVSQGDRTHRILQALARYLKAVPEAVEPAAPPLLEREVKELWDRRELQAVDPGLRWLTGVGLLNPAPKVYVEHVDQIEHVTRVFFTDTISRDLMPELRALHEALRVISDGRHVRTYPNYVAIDRYYPTRGEAASRVDIDDARAEKARQILEALSRYFESIRSISPDSIDTPPILKRKVWELGPGQDIQSFDTRGIWYKGSNQIFTI